MKKELQILIQIESTTGKGSQGEKQQLIKDNNSDILTYFLQIALDPWIRTNINKVDVLETPINNNEITIDTVKNELDILINSKAANNQIRERIHHILNTSTLSYEERVMLGKIISKSLNIGIGIKSVNKALGKELIPDVSVMLADMDNDELIKWFEEYNHAWVEEKYDGVRVLVIKENGKISLFTRNFNQLLGLTNLELEIEKLLKDHDNIFIDGELTDLNRQSVSGKVNQILKGTAIENIDRDFLFHLFDTDSIGIYKNKEKGVKSYEDRRKDLDNLYVNYDGNMIRVATRWLAESVENVMGIYQEIVNLGGEGVIIKKPNHVYELKRTVNWNKIKEIKDCDLVITGWYEGKGKRKGGIGGFICQTSCGQLEVGVGSGFSDSYLAEINENGIQSYIGKIAKIQYNVIITNKKGEHSLFLPRLVEVRPDKDIANTLEELK